MDKVVICHGCGRTIDDSFFYCPWCGVAAGSEVGSPSDIAGKIDTLFDELETMQAAWTGTRLVRMENELGSIERALSEMLSGTQSP